MANTELLEAKDKSLQFVFWSEEEEINNGPDNETDRECTESS
jgi:hypothetical protein